MKSYKANGKVLLTGEYMILDGAVGIGLPTYHGQRLQIKKIIHGDSPSIEWRAFDQGDQRFHGIYNKTSQSWIATTDSSISNHLSHLFEYKNYFGSIHQDNQSYSITTRLSYPREWGLGSSSTLIYLYAQIIGADPYDLHLYHHPRGSGYDIACAGASGPLLFQKNPSDLFHVTPIDRRPSYAEHLYFAYSGHKQNSLESIATYRAATAPIQQTIDRISSISYQLIQSQELETSRKLIEEHELVIAEHLSTIPIQMSCFADAPAGCTIKSLGGRGGDFLMIMREGERSDLSSYLSHHHIDTLFSRDEFIL